MTAYIDQISSLGPKVWYRFNETAGTPVNFGSLSTTSIFNDLLLNEQTDVDGRCVYFNGSSSYIRLPQWNSFSLFDDRSFTTEVWFKIAYADTLTSTGESTVDRYRPIFTFVAEDSKTLLAQIGTSFTQSIGTGTRGKLRVTSEFGTSRTYNSTETYADDLWHHLVVTENTTSFKVYVDGVLKYNQTLSASPVSIDMDNNSTRPISGKLIGARTNEAGGDTIMANGNKFKGRLDEFAIYGYELTAQNILDNFNAGSSVNFADIPGTASSLMVNPAWSVETVLPADPMTASADGAGHAASTVNFPTMLNTYMSELTLQTWYKFDVYKTLVNYGTTATVASAYSVENKPTGGLQGSGSIVYTGGSGTALDLISDNVTSSIADEDFSIGFWTKRTSPEYASIISFFDTAGTDNVALRWNEEGGIQYVITHSSTQHVISSTTDITDGNWHYVAATLSGGTMQLWIDGVSIGTQTMNQNLTLNKFIFGGDAGTTSTELFEVSQFYIATSANVGSTQISNIYTAGTSASVQASATMTPASTKFNSAFNDYIESKSPLIDFRLDDINTVPVNLGSAELIVSPTLDPKGYTQGETGLNNRAFKFTSRDQNIRGFYNTPSGTLSDSDVCTIGILFKNNSTANQQGHVGFGGRDSTAATGNGFSLQMLASSGYLRVLAGNGNGTVSNITGNINYSDNKWHLAVIVKESSTLKLYVDGKLHVSGSSSAQLTDEGEFIINGIAGITNSAATVDKLIDEIFVTNTAFTAQEVFEAWQALRLEMDTTATAELPMPTNIAGTGTTQAADAQTASSLLEMPGFSTDQIPTIDVATASAEFLLPNYGGNVVIDANYGHQSFTASALFNDPQFNIGEVHEASHMHAEADMVHPAAIAAGSIAVSTAVGGPAVLVMPGIVTIKGARVFAEPMRSNAIFPLPPAYIQLADDDWYVRLYAGHFDGLKEPIQSSSGSIAGQASTSPVQGGFLTFFDDVTTDITPTTATNIFTSEIGKFAYTEPDEYDFESNGDLVPLDTTGTETRATASRQSNTPQAILSTGLFDPFERKAVRVTNIEFPFQGTNKSYSNRPYNIEFSIKTTKSDQILTHGYYSSPNVNTRIIGAVGLSDGKIYLAEETTFKILGSGLGAQRAGVSTSAPHPKNFKDRAGYLIGRTNIADGNWHHVIIQQGFGTENLRTQIWVDGKLDRQIIVPGPTPGIDGTNQIRPYILGFNSSDSLLYSDFETSAWNFYPGRFIDSRSIGLNYSAYLKSKPIKVEPFTATVTTPQNHKAAGNRARALMLFWWPKTGVSGTTVGSDGQGTIDQGRFGIQDESTFDTSLLTLDLPGDIPQQYYGWDIFPVDVTGQFGTGYTRGQFYQSDMLKPEVWTSSDGYRDLDTGARRYIDLMKDLDISQFDAIFFRNFPEQSPELDAYVREDLADSYFGLAEEDLYRDFIASLRAAVDTGISLYVTNAKLALDLGIIDGYQLVGDMNEGDLDPTSAFVTTKLQYLTQPSTGVYKDTNKNNKFRIVNTLPGLTDEPGYVWRDWMYFYNYDDLNFGGPNKPFSSVLNKPNGLSIGDEFLMSDSGTNSYQYEATPFANVKAGKIITAFSNTINKNGVEVENPYKNYATIIALEPGTILRDKPIGGKILVNFTERLSSFTRGGDGLPVASRDNLVVELIQDEFINLAYNNGLITAERRDELLASPNNLDRALEQAIAEGQPTAGIMKLKYWTFNGNNILSQRNVLDDGTGSGVEKDGLGDGIRRSRVNKVNKQGSISTRSIASSNVWFTFSYSYLNPLLQLAVPSMLTRGFRWLSSRIVDEGLVNRVESMNVATSELVMPVITADKDRTIYAQPMLANARIVHAPGYALADVAISTLPLFADAKFGDFVKNIVAEPFIASALIRQPRIAGIEEDEVVVYINHVDPILYLMEDIIK